VPFIIFYYLSNVLPVEITVTEILNTAYAVSAAGWLIDLIH
jgi:hypothetical protein